MIIGDRLRELREEKKLSGRHREENWAAAMLHISCRKWSHCSRDRDLGEDGPGFGSATVPALL